MWYHFTTRDGSGEGHFGWTDDPRIAEAAADDLSCNASHPGQEYVPQALGEDDDVASEAAGVDLTTLDALVCTDDTALIDLTDDPEHYDLATRLHRCQTLAELHDTLRDIRLNANSPDHPRHDDAVQVLNSDAITDLPTYGGPEPEDTSEVWSWDADRLLVSDGNGDFRIVPRGRAQEATA